MKKVSRIILFSLVAVLILLLLFTALFRMEKGEKSFEASIVKIEEDCLFIAPLPAEEEMRQASEIKIEQKQLTETELLPLKEGEQITVLYDGEIIPGKPAKLGTVYAIRPSESR